MLSPPEPQLLKPTCLEPVVCNRATAMSRPHSPQPEKARAAVKIQHSQKQKTHLAVTVHQGGVGRVGVGWGGSEDADLALNFCKSEENQCPLSSRIS